MSRDCTTNEEDTAFTAQAIIELTEANVSANGDGDEWEREVGFLHNSANERPTPVRMTSMRRSNLQLRSLERATVTLVTLPPGGVFRFVSHCADYPPYVGAIRPVSLIIRVKRYRIGPPFRG